MKIEVLKCKACGNLAISVDDLRIDTQSAAAHGHGSGKCAGHWTVQVSADYSEPNQSSLLEEARELLLKCIRDLGLHADLDAKIEDFLKRSEVK